MDAVAQLFRRKQSLGCAEARPARGHREKPVMRAQILRDQRHLIREMIPGTNLFGTVVESTMTPSTR